MAEAEAATDCADTALPAAVVTEVLTVASAEAVATDWAAMVERLVDVKVEAV